MNDGVLVMRLVMSAEVQLAASGRDTPVRFRSLADVIANGEVSALKRDVTVIDSEDGLYKGYSLRVAAQGARYEASLTPDKGCGLAFFVNEKNVIYTGRGLGCDEKTPAPER
jgi:hypothetical protein